MEKEFVTYEIAKRLKELEFTTKDTFAFWVERTVREKTFIRLSFGISDRDDRDEVLFIAPLWQQVIDWLRIEHELIIKVIPINDWFGVVSYGIGVKGKKLSNQFHEETFAVDPYDFDLKTYEQAREAAILKALTLITNE